MTRTKSGAAADPGDLLSYRLSVVSNLLSRSQLSGFAAVADISLPEWRVLVLVQNYGPLSVKSLARHAGLDFGQASRLVSRMCEAGLVLKHATDDARSVDLLLTARGRAMQQRLWKVAMRCNDEFLASLSAAEKQVLFKALDTLAGKAKSALAAGAPPTTAARKKAAGGRP
jgi:DNA-binding MarR family transcriptional regulator